MANFYATLLNRSLNCIPASDYKPKFTFGLILPKSARVSQMYTNVLRNTRGRIYKHRTIRKQQFCLICYFYKPFKLRRTEQLFGIYNRSLTTFLPAIINPNFTFALILRKSTRVPNRFIQIYSQILRSMHNQGIRNESNYFSTFARHLNSGERNSYSGI